MYHFYFRKYFMVLDRIGHWLVQYNSDQTFQLIIQNDRLGNFVYHNGKYILIYRLLSYPLISLSSLYLFFLY